MPSLRDEEIEAEARAMVRERIESSPWFQIGMTKAQRREAIEQEVNRTWHLFISDAAKRLDSRAAQAADDA